MKYKYNKKNTQVVIVEGNQIVLLADYNKSRRNVVDFAIIDMYGNIVSERTKVRLKKWKDGDKRIKGEIMSGKFKGLEVECNLECFEIGEAYKLLGFTGTEKNISNACDIKLLPGYGMPSKNIREMISHILDSLPANLVYEVYLFVNSLKNR